MTESAYFSANQDPNTGYFVLWLEGERIYRIVPLVKGREYVIERSWQPHQRRKGKKIWLPLKPGASRKSLVGKIRVSGSRCYLFAEGTGWSSREEIRIFPPSWLGTESFRVRGKYELEGFESVHFEASPKVKAWYVPPLVDLNINLPERVLEDLQSTALWASAAVGWQRKGEYRQAKKCWERALQTCEKEACAYLAQANVMLSMANTLLSLDKNFYQEQINGLRKRALEVDRSLPRILYRSSSKVIQQGEPLSIDLYVENQTPERELRDIRLRYECEGLGLYQSFDIPKLSFREYKKYFLRVEVKDGFQAGEYPVEVLVEFPLKGRQLLEYHFSDWIRIYERRAQIRVGGDAGAVIIDSGEGLTPDVDIEGDAGLVKIVRRKR